MVCGSNQLSGKYYIGTAAAVFRAKLGEAVKYIAVDKDAVPFLQQKFQSSDLGFDGAAPGRKKFGFRMPVKRKLTAGQAEKFISVILDGKLSFSMNGQFLKIFSHKYIL